MRKTFFLLVAVLLAAFGIVTAQDGENEGSRDQTASQRKPQEPRYKGREHIQVDREALQGMSREERRATMQAYKAAREAEAARSGIALKSGNDTVIPLDEPRATGKPETPGRKGPFTRIQYDTGVVFGISGTSSEMVGNRFDTAIEGGGTMCCFPVEQSGSITMITFDMVNTFFTSAIWSLYSNVMGTSADQVTSRGRSVMPGLNTLTVDSASTSNTYMNGTFLAGIWQFTPMSTAVGLDTNSTGSQGFHAVRINDGALGTGLMDVTSGGMGLNAIFRVRGNVATPVELMSFEIEED